MNKKIRILVTGGAGFIGSHLCEALLNKGYQVTAFDNLSTGNIKNLDLCQKSTDFRLFVGNINNKQEFRQVFKIPFDFIYHYAAVVGVKRTLQSPLDVLDDIDGIRNVLDLAREKEVKRIFYSSSSEVYGESTSFPQLENTTPLNSRLPYAAVKNLGEIYIKAFSKEYGLKFTIFRFFNTYGPRQSPDFVISKFIKQALKNEDLTVFGTGKQTRSFNYISDNINPTVLALTKNASINQIINIGNPVEINMNSLAKTIIEVCGSKSKIAHLPPLNEGDMSRRVPEISLMKKLLDFKPELNIIQGLTKTIKYLKDQNEI